MTSEHDSRLQDLEETRLRANMQIEKLSSEMGICQTELNVLLLEAQKYESQVHFLMSEREMLIQASQENELDYDERVIEDTRKSLR